MQSSEPCRESSLRCGAPLIATAVEQTTTWFLLENRDPWAPRAPEALQLPAEVRARFDGWLARTAGSRAQLIRRPQRSSEPLAFYVVRCGPRDPCVHRIELDRYEDLLDIDLERVLATPAEPVDEPLVLVCTHGKRDPCCAKWGVPVYERAAVDPRFDVWQSSHLGGHRFAATLVVFPRGACYGRVAPDDVPALLEATTRGELWDLEHFRGHVWRDAVSMAAEHFARTHAGLAGEVRIDSCERRDGSAFEATVRAGDRSWTFAWRSSVHPTQVLPSCGKPAESIRIPRLERMNGGDGD